METSKKMQTDVLKKPADSAGVNTAELSCAGAGGSAGPPWVHRTAPKE